MTRRYGDRTERIEMRCTPMEKLELEAEAKRRNTTLSALLIGAALGVVAVAVDASKEQAR